MAYSRIEGLPSQAAAAKLASSELGELGRRWLAKKGELAHSGEFKAFLQKLLKEWAIETGILERLYTWDRGLTETLIEQEIDAALISRGSGLEPDAAHQAARMIQDQQQVVEGLFPFVKGDQPLSEHFIRAMHEQFTQHQEYTEALARDGALIRVPLLKGQYKKLPNNPRRPDGQMHDFCPPEFVKEEMQRLVSLYKGYASQDMPPEILSAWLHHRFTQIHPFQDGNGRIARALASLVFLKAGLFPLVIRESERTAYIEALEAADQGQLAPLVALFASRQRDSILSALNIPS